MIQEIKKMYMEIPVLTEEMWDAVKAANENNRLALNDKISLTAILEKWFPGCVTFRTWFIYHCDIYYIDTDDKHFSEWSSKDKKWNRLLHSAELPPIYRDVEKIVEVEKVTGVSEELMLKAIAAVSGRKLA